MLVPHLHFSGRCEEAIRLYERAFNTKLDTILYNREITPGEQGVGHAEMHIHGQRVMMNDRFGNADFALNTDSQMVMVYKTEEALRAAYQIMSEGSVTIDPIQNTFYSPCVVVFMDRFGIHWAFMVDEEAGTDG